MTGRALDGERLLARLPQVRGRLTRMRALADLTWFRVGGPAEVLFQPADIDDLSGFLAACPEDIPVLPVGFGSNLLVRDGRLPGVVVLLGPGGAAVGAGGPRGPAGAAPARPWGTLIAVLLGLFASLGLHAFLGLLTTEQRGP